MPIELVCIVDTDRETISLVQNESENKLESIIETKPNENWPVFSDSWPVIRLN